jgi:hypothetical protein
VIVLVSIGLISEIQLRPQVFTYAMLGVIAWMLAHDNFRGRAPIRFAIAMLALWANLHGGFIVGLAALGVYASVAGARDLWCGRGLRRALRFAAIVAPATVATLLTLWSRHLAIGAADDFTSAMLSHVSEWQSLLTPMAAESHLPRLAVVFDVVLIAVLGGLLVTVALSPYGDDLPLVAVAMLMITATLRALRNIPPGLIGCAAPLARHTALAIRRLRQAESSKTGDAAREWRHADVHHSDRCRARSEDGSAVAQARSGSQISRGRDRLHESARSERQYHLQLRVDRLRDVSNRVALASVHRWPLQDDLSGCDRARFHGFL